MVWSASGILMAIHEKNIYSVEQLQIKLDFTCVNLDIESAMQYIQLDCTHPDHRLRQSKL